MSDDRHQIPARLAPFLAQWDYVVEMLFARMEGLTDEEYLRVGEKKYRGLSPPATAGGPPDPAAMEDAVLATIQLPPETLRGCPTSARSWRLS